MHIGRFYIVLDGKMLMSLDTMRNDNDRGMLNEWNSSETDLEVYILP